ncbi:DUF4118 domain-containing protein [Vogesella mureinivorans]|uniref:DUF4118 domain-containing protein n=1 Tax=Vogesella mureinivorans TaxID=657276 RepID=UPI0011C8F2FF|nr:DUF4118 domain-containing protein [Vogesella mureinivorans]
MTDPDRRPDPDALLASLPRPRGRLKLFFGAAPGVGKTYAMLAEAQEKRAQGLDVLVGWVDTHGRADTEAMLHGLALLPRRQLDHRSKTVAALDIDAILARRPALVVVDELPHSNAAGSRHPKRWQDVEELLASGIDVYSAMNVQHLYSLRDIVSRVTGVEVAETVPDHVFDQADEVRLVDLPPDDLLQRLAAGKVYLPEVAERAAANFFRKGNLIALRELALRRMADRVDGQMKAQRATQQAAPVWATRHGLLLLVDGRFGADSVRQCQRLARQLGAAWHAVWVDDGHTSGAQRAAALAALQQAAEQGATTLVLSGQSTPRLLVDYARRHNLSLLAMAAPQARPRLQRALQQHAGDLDLLLLSGQAPAAGAQRWLQWPQWQLSRQGWLAASLLCVAITVLASPLHGVLEPTNLVMFYLLGVLWVAVRYGRGPAALSAVLSVALFDFFFVQPHFSFAVSDVQYLITFAVMLIVGLVAGQLVASQRHTAAQARQREAHTRTLYEMARELGVALLPEQVGEISQRFLHASLGANVRLWLPPDDEDGVLQPQAGDALGEDAAIVRWCYDHAAPAGIATHTLPQAPCLYLPLKAPMRTRGVLVLRVAEPAMLGEPDNRRLAEAVAALAAQTLERLHYIAVAQQTLVAMESERLRHSLLAALSHDLRTPLTALTGQAETLQRQLAREASPHAAQAATLQAQSQRISRLVTNLLEMARLQAGGVTLRRDWLPPQELFGSAIAALGSATASHRLQVDAPLSCPMLYADPILLERLLVNLLENALKYSPAGSTITLTATASAQHIVLSVADQGRGLPPGDPDTLFTAFTRGERESAISGVGLGLAICRTIADVHGGRIAAANLPAGGACFTLSLPLAPQPALDFDPENLQ